MSVGRAQHWVDVLVEELEGMSACELEEVVSYLKSKICITCGGSPGCCSNDE